MQKPLKVLFLTDNFPPEVNAPASRTFEHAREWVRAGHQVTVLTGAPNFPEGKLYAGYHNRLWQEEQMDGIRVVRVWTYITANQGLVRRILDYASFMVACIVAAPFVGKADIVVGTSPQFFTACAAYLLSRMKRIPFVFELRDIWPESIKAVGIMHNRALLRLLEGVEMFLYGKASRIVSVTSSFKQVLVSRGVAANKIAVVTNGVDLSGFFPRPKDTELAARVGLNGKFIAGYVGTHGMAHALETILEAAARIQRIDNAGTYQFLLLGNGARKRELMERASRMGLTNVVFLNTVPKAEVPRYWSLLDVSIIHLKRTALFTTVIPSKLFESMGMGIPVLHGVEGESAEIVQKEGVGLIFEPENAAELCENLLRLHSDKKLYMRIRENCLAAAPHYDRSALAKLMLKVLTETALKEPMRSQSTHKS